MGENFLRFYHENAATYIEETKGIDMSKILHQFLGYLPQTGHILDLGCGSGRDTIFFQQHGYTVTAMDAVSEIASICSRNIGQEVIVMSAQSMDARTCYDGIWACASLLHIPERELGDTLHRLNIALKPGGVCYMSFKKGQGERWDEKGRFFFDTTPDIIRQALCHIEEINILDIEEQISPLRGKHQTWVNVFFRKR
jgi:SAM-dependent methyltransferase